MKKKHLIIQEMITNKIDEEYINDELNKLFSNLKLSKQLKGERLQKYSSRFYNEMNKSKNFYGKSRKEYLSIGKKLEILCTYTNHRLVKF